MNKRDLKADLEMCNKATPEPWLETDESNLEVFVENTRGEPVLYELWVDGPHTAIKQEDMEFMIEAREGWPYAIRKVLEQEIIMGAMQMAYADQKEHVEELEELVRELVEVLRDANGYIQHHIEYGHIPSPKGDTPLLVHTPSSIRSALAKAKEVLDHGNA